MLQPRATATRDTARDELLKRRRDPDFALTAKARRRLFREVLFAILAEITLHQAPISGSLEETLLDDAVLLLIHKCLWLIEQFECSPIFRWGCIGKLRIPARGPLKSEQWGQFQSVSAGSSGITSPDLPTDNDTV